MKLKLAVLAVCVAVSLPAVAAQWPMNVIKNGDFEKEGYTGQLFLGWNANMMGYMPRAFGKDDKGRNILHYICGCGYDLGLKKPWVGLICPKCFRVSVAEETGSWYDGNPNYVKAVNGKAGRCVFFDIPKDIGENQGVRLISDLVKVKRDWPYQVTADCWSEGPVQRIFIEAYRLVGPGEERTPGSKDFTLEEGEEGEAAPADDARKDEAKPDETTKADDANPSEATGAKKDDLLPGKDLEVEKTYRVNEVAAGGRVDRTFMPPKRYKIDFIQVKLYGYMPGKCYFDNVVVRPLTPQEAAKWVAQQKPKKDKRFR